MAVSEDTEYIGIYIKDALRVWKKIKKAEERGGVHKRFTRDRLAFVEKYLLEAVDIAKRARNNLDK